MEPCELSPSGVFDLYSCRSSKLLQKCNVVLNYAETFYKSNVNCTFFFLYKNKFQKRRVWTCGVLKGGGGGACVVEGVGWVTFTGLSVVMVTSLNVGGRGCVLNPFGGRGTLYARRAVRKSEYLTDARHATKPNATAEGVSSEPGPSCFSPRP